MEIPMFAKPFYVLHIAEGLVNYPEVEKMRLLREETLRKMDPTFAGKPVRFGAQHLNAGDTEKIAKAEHKGALVDGVVVNSFFNENDGRHWCKVMVWDEDALHAIGKGIGVSNAYVMNSKAPGGDYHATPYDEEVMDGTYDHLLITDSPRYEESMKVGFLTPEQFDEYNKSRKDKLALVKNSKESEMGFFERKAAEIKLDGVEWVGVKSKKTFLITNVLNAVDEEAKKEEDGEAMANMNHNVKVGNATMKLCDLMAAHGKAVEENIRLKNENDAWEEAAKKAENAQETEEEKKKREDAEKAKNDVDDEEKKKREDAEKAKNAVDDEEKKKKDEEKAENMKRIQNKIDRLKGAPTKHFASLVSNSASGNDKYEQPVIRFKEDAVADGLEHYGTLDK